MDDIKPNKSSINLYLNNSGLLVSADGNPVTIQGNAVSPALVKMSCDAEVITEENQSSFVWQKACTTENVGESDIKIQQHLSDAADTPTKKVLDRVYVVMKEIDDDYGDSEDEFTASQKLWKPAGRPRANKCMPNDRKSNINGSNFIRAIADNAKFIEDAEPVYNYCKDGVNPYPKGSNVRHELPRKSKNYYVNNSILYLSKTRKVKSEYTVHKFYILYFASHFCHSQFCHSHFCHTF